MPWGHSDAESPVRAVDPPSKVEDVLFGYLVAVTGPHVEGRRIG